MSGFLSAVLSLPTVLFTPLLVVVIGYWIVVIAGGTDPEGDGTGDGDGPLGFLGLGGVPASVALSILIAVAWFASLAGGRLFTAIPVWLVLLAALAVAWVATLAGVRVIRRLLPTGVEPSRNDFLGRTCVIRTGRVTRDFGQAEVHSPDGSSAIVQVRQAGDDDLRAGTVALLFDVDPEGEFFWVVPADIATTPDQ